MKQFSVKTTEVNFSIEIEDETTDAVTGASWTGDAYGAIVYSKASATNPMLPFRATGASVIKTSTGANPAITAFVQDANTGFVGVKYQSPAAGDIITVAGIFVKDDAGNNTFHSIAIDPIGPISEETYSNNGDVLPNSAVGIIFQ